MKLRNYAITFALAGMAWAGSQAMAGWFGPTPYLRFADSPFSGFSYSGYFHLENFEDGLANSPGLTLTPVGGGGGLLLDGTASSVDLDDGVIDGTARGVSYRLGWSSQTTPSRLNLTFDAASLGGQLPTDVGFVRVIGLSGDMSINIYDGSDTLVATVLHSVGGFPFSYTTEDDRFYGYRHLPGISRVEIINPLASYTQFDHIQYGAVPSPVPEASTVGSGLAIGGLAIWGACKRNRAPKREACGKE